MEFIAHEWIENFAEYEAVMQCLNPLAPWDKGATVRAFQTFDWNHASPPGGDLQFAHSNTSVVVRYDGAVVAILFGMGRLNDALPDLFAVLQSLGWQLAEVYHPAESLAGLLTDFGKAIPANMDFDVKPAKSLQRISDFAEVPLLIAQVKKVLKTEGMDANDIILEEMLSMDIAHTKGQGLSPTTGAFASMVLEDDIGESPAGEYVGTIANELPPTLPATRPTIRQAAVFVTPKTVPADLDDDRPRVFSTFKASTTDFDTVAVTVAVDEEVGRPTINADDVLAQTQAELVIENDHLQDTLSDALERALHLDNEVLALTQAQNKSLVLIEELSTKNEIAAAKLSFSLLANNSLQEGASILEKKLNECVEAKAAFELENTRLQSLTGEATIDVLKVGVSAFCFDLPSSPISDADTANLHETYGTQEIVHLFPGAIDASIRWDVLAEIIPEFPWYVEKLVGSMGFSGSEAFEVCKLLLNLKQKNPIVQLRELIDSAGPDLIEVIGQLVGPLVLCPVERAFVDVPAVRGNGDPEIFSIHGVSLSPFARLFVVHVDVLDGPFVAWMTELLRLVVQMHSVSKRYHQVISGEGIPTTKTKEIGYPKEIASALANEVADHRLARSEKWREMDCV